ncbi:MAG: methyl-accepting chemotaxis protein [Actinobacteria bacterium]|nr:methyl-accepting chemotaxis protein [Actinomycetota bacterium]
MTRTEYDQIGRRLAIRYIACLTATVVLLVAQTLISGLVSGETFKINTIITAILAPPFILFAYSVLARGFRFCRDAALEGDLEQRSRAIEIALASPGRSTKAFLAVWVVGMPVGLALTHVFGELSRSDLVGYLLTFAGVIVVTGFPVYAVVEKEMRVVLRDLFERVGGDLDIGSLAIKRFGIPTRVGLAMGSLVVSSLIYLMSRDIASELGVAVSDRDDAFGILVEVPVLWALTTFVGWAVTTSLRGSIDELAGGVRLAAEGDLTHRTAVTTTDDLGRLMVRLDVMLRRQAELIRAATAVAAELSASAGAVADGSEQSTQGVSQIAHAMQDVVTGAQSQFEQVEAARRASAALAAAIEQATGATARATDLSADAYELAGRGAGSARQAGEAIEGMKYTIDQANAAVDRLGGDTKDIGTIVETIVLIADQTNLLALNAAIEAARAGEAGRGFAVVAEEVRKLASESNDAAARIAELIDQVAATIESTIAAVNRGGEEVARGVTVVSEAGGRFGEIADALTQIGDHVAELDHRVGQVAGATSEVSDAVEGIVRVTESMAALAEQTSANTEESSAASEEITSSADSLRAMSKSLENQISSFEVGA